MHKFAAALFLSAAFSLAGMHAAQPTSKTAEIQEAIRANDLSRLQQLVNSKDSANLPDRLQWTPLHYASLYGSPAAVLYLLQAGADSNALSQQGDSPLIYGSWSLAITKLLVEHGANVNVAGKKGETALISAASSGNNLDTVRFLVDHGADLKAVNGLGMNALSVAARNSNVATLEYLISKGAPSVVDKTGQSALNWAVPSLNPAQVTSLITSGDNPNSSNVFGGMVKNGPIQLVHLTPLMLAAPHSPTQVVSALLKCGAQVNAVDIRKMNALMLSIATDHATPETVQVLVAAGTDLGAKDAYGATAMDWAARFQNPRIIQILQKAGMPAVSLPEAPHPPTGSEPKTTSEAIARSVKLFTDSGPSFFKEGGGCSGCHHQIPYGRAYATLHRQGFATEPSLQRTFLDSVTAIRPGLLSGLPLMDGPPGDLDSVLYPIMTLVRLQQPANTLTDAAVHYVAARQQPSGAWMQDGIARPPIEDSNIMRTTFAIRALAYYGWPARKAEFAAKIDRGRVWLKQATPVTTYEMADRLDGLHTAGATDASLKADVEALLALQRKDGGWAQTPFLESDAYATGLVLSTLHEDGLIAPTDTRYLQGVSFLMKTQFPDGSWYVRSRAPKFQPYFQSGFPFDHDQWISSAASALATAALAPVAKPMIQVASSRR